MEAIVRELTRKEILQDAEQIVTKLVDELECSNRPGIEAEVLLNNSRNVLLTAASILEVMLSAKKGSSTLH